MILKLCYHLAAALVSLVSLICSILLFLAFLMGSKGGHSPSISPTYALPDMDPVHLPRIRE
jgi:hypothetical protein